MQNAPLAEFQSINERELVDVFKRKKSIIHPICEIYPTAANKFKVLSVSVLLNLHQICSYKYTMYLRDDHIAFIFSRIIVTYSYI